MEDIGQLIGKGFGIWKRNLNLCIPYLLNVFASMLIVVAFLVAIFVAALPLMGGDSALFSNIEDLGETQESEVLFSQMDAHLAGLEWQTLLMIVVLFLGMILVLSLVGSTSTPGPSAWPGRLRKRAGPSPAPYGLREGSITGTCSS